MARPFRIGATGVWVVLATRTNHPNSETGRAVFQCAAGRTRSTTLESVTGLQVRPNPPALPKLFGTSSQAVDPQRSINEVGHSSDVNESRPLYVKRMVRRQFPRRWPPAMTAQVQTPSSPTNTSQRLRPQPTSPKITDKVKFYDSKLGAWRPVLVLALMTFGLAACSMSGPHSSAIKDSTSPKSPGLTTTTLGPVSPGQPRTTIGGGVPRAPIAPSTTPTTAPIGPPCGNSELAVSIQTGFEGTGSASEELGFRNVGQSPCTLYGYPGVAALNAQGQQIVQGDRNGDLPSAVGLQPGAIAASLVSGSDGSLPQCAGSHTDSFLVTPPNLTHSVEVTAANSFGSIAISCGIDISPVTPEPAQPIPAGASSTTSD